MINKFLGMLNKFFKRDDWTTVNPDEELKEWIDQKDVVKEPTVKGNE